jgi:hypothetical protein
MGDMFFGAHSVKDGTVSVLSPTNMHLRII